MLTLITIWFFIVKLSIAQLNGEFWWLNDRLTDYNRVRPPPPKFENISEFDNDENARIVFKDDNLIPNHVATRPTDKPIVNDDNKLPVKNISVNNEHYKDHAKPELPDRFVFKFPEDHFVWKDFSNANNAKLPVTENGIEDSSNVYDINDKKSENVCNMMKLTECYKNNGLVHKMKYVKKIYINQELVCCVLPLPSRPEYASSKIYFPDEPRGPTYKRRKRSSKKHDDLKQRDILLQRRHTHFSRQGTTQRIATPDYEDDDPYWNIKTIKSTNKQQQVTKKHGYGADDYEEDYASEIPKPGLTGIYSDMKPNWPSQNDGEYGEYSDEYVDENDDTGTFGYSTVDPRRVTDSKSKSKQKPVKLTATSEDTSYNAESQTISYQSKPNFNVFQDFKLLLRYKGKPKVQRRSTTVDSIIDDSKEPSMYEDIDDSTDLDYEDHQVYQDCEKTVLLSKLNKEDKQMGQTVNGSHPWVALVVSTRKRNSILCYATLIHPRAAMTVANCVYGKSPGEITILTGMWDLDVIPRATSRAVSIRVHSKYRHGEMAHNLAILHWMRPLETSVNVRPACLARPHFGDECMFFGWGGFDQAMKRKPRWQRASMDSCKGSLSFINGSLPGDAFCATVVSRNTVTGMGGSLMCNNGGRLSAVGVVVSRDSTLALLPVHQWALAAMTALN